MFKRYGLILCFFLLGFALLGCWATGLPTEYETPSIHADDPDFWAKTPFKTMPTRTKCDFLKAKGEPNKIIHTSDNTETWVYERHHLWCGALIIIVIIPLPFMLPVCDSYERIDFEGDVAKRVHIREIVYERRILGVQF